ncbi:MAG: hypothetical protein ACI9R3_003684 [Verrucomicrobiales bacterium]
MTTIANCFDLMGAERIRMLLASRGIEAFIPNSISAGLLPHFTTSGVRVQVEDSLADQARAIVKEFEEADQDSEE